ncbi:unnamed protein product [Arabidopsis lyrata]|uniref:uncharacterized protein LOC110229662 n=1 Tax=Arabidopsis lyrata subsp. lyrata TaxID=81972 RepID=UPI000A29BBB2|nr:uncharacterized protein LOC110229662 [Arabidopsis lyrata subsp. lyrata]CAH8261950.1 unnamed protein product [Arabidopsis lyrata]|eukprot:XP_020885942.1 uncharacterized protein LOC110229662 [Arabidopsis lyrata subsp. lyrata]
MASSSQILKYPPRLYEEGKSPLQNRSMNHSCYFFQIGKIREGLGPDVWDGLMKSTLGVFIKLTDVEYTWAAQTVHYFLTNQLRVDNSHEIWCLIDQRPIRFSLYEFADVTGLNCDFIDESDTCEAAYHEFWNEMGVGTSDGPLFSELEHVMDISKAWNYVMDISKANCSYRNPLCLPLLIQHELSLSLQHKVEQ